MRLFKIALSVLVTIGCGVVACDNDPKYPNCTTDEQCKQVSSGDPVDEYCVNQACQECRTDAHCDLGKVCQDGRCDEKSQCPCDAGQQCVDDQCVDAQCNEDAECGAGQRCEAHNCIEGCTTDQECGAGMKCVHSSCESSGGQVSSDCRPMNRSNDVVALTSVRFEFNRADLTLDTRDGLDRNASCLRQAPSTVITLEGHCDERGTQEYNLALGDRRAKAVKEYLLTLGVGDVRFRTVSKGKNEPLCRDSSAACFNKNRRVEFIQGR